MRLLHDLKALTRAQHKKLSAQSTQKNGKTTDVSAMSAAAASDLSPDGVSQGAPNTTPLVETVEEEDFSLDVHAAV